MADTNWKVGDVDGCLCTMSSKHSGYHLLHSIHLVSCFWLLHNEGLLQSSAVLYHLLGEELQNASSCFFFTFLLSACGLPSKCSIRTLVFCIWCGLQDCGYSWGLAQPSAGLFMLSLHIFDWHLSQCYCYEWSYEG